MFIYSKETIEAIEEEFLCLFCFYYQYITCMYVSIDNSLHYRAMRMKHFNMEVLVELYRM